MHDNVIISKRATDSTSTLFHRRDEISMFFHDRITTYVFNCVVRYLFWTGCNSRPASRPGFMHAALFTHMCDYNAFVELYRTHKRFWIRGFAVN